MYMAWEMPHTWAISHRDPLHSGRFALSLHCINLIMCNLICMSDLLMGQYAYSCLDAVWIHGDGGVWEAEITALQTSPRVLMTT